MHPSHAVTERSRTGLRQRRLQSYRIHFAALLSYACRVVLHPRKLHRSAMALTGNWLIVQRFVTTALYKLLRLAFVIVQSIFWQLNGTARKIREARLPHNYERSAQVLDVLLVHKFCRIQNITVDNFLCTHNRFEHPQYIIDNDNITLMTINEHDAVFCEPVKKGVYTALVFFKASITTDSQLL